MNSTEKENSPLQRLRFRISGAVQGVGFRPFVYGYAQRFNLSGFVGNDSRGVFVEVEGLAANLNNFQDALGINSPQLAHITAVEVKEIVPTGEKGFRIVESEVDNTQNTLISPDVSLCKDCLRELFNENDRRFHYPFINCTNCGPRFTIIQDIPYDRPKTTMSGFQMCGSCQNEYENPLDRRFHAQPNACPDCGPKLFFYDATTQSQEETKTDGIEQVRRSLLSDHIVAIKGIGGFHLACDAKNEKAVKTLRTRKGRVDKPFAVMCKDLETAKKFVEINDAETEVLTSKERPIVLLKKKNCGRTHEINVSDLSERSALTNMQVSALSEQIAPNNQFLGVMLPYSPLHYLLFSESLEILVMTSGNYSNEPIVKDNDEALEKLSHLADAFLLHDREIAVQCDDSIVRVWNLEPEKQNDTLKEILPFTFYLLPYRRSRGYAPFPVELPFKVPQILAVGGELKATFCLTKDNFAFMSQHIGDMENLETLRAFELSVDGLKKTFRVEPEIVVYDLHPNYLSSNWAKANAAENVKLVGVQHHHAHIASVMAENGVMDEKVIGFAFDGTGFGFDGKIWGGEVLFGDYTNFERLTHLRYFPLAGSDVSVKNVFRLALSLLREAGIEWSADLDCVSFCSETEQKILWRQLENNLNVVQTSSFGRLFDAIASIANIRHKATYEAQAAIEFEAVLEENISDTYEFELWENEIDYRNLLREVVKDVRADVHRSIISAKFHNAVANLILKLSLKYRKSLNLNKIALSGGCFQNVALLKASLNRLQQYDFEILIHRQVPPNDGGLALGQAVIAAHLDK